MDYLITLNIKSTINVSLIKTLSEQDLQINKAPEKNITVYETGKVIIK